MLNPSLQAGVASSREAVPCKGTTAENDHRHDRYQSVTAHKLTVRRHPVIWLTTRRVS
jgi:hypothetical protein